MVFVDVLVGAAIGQVCALGASQELEASPSSVHGRAFGRSLLYVALVYAPSVMYFNLRWPSLSWAHLVVPSPLLDISFLVAVFLAFTIGFSYTREVIRRHRPELAWAGLGVVVVAMGILVGVLWERATFVADDPSAFARRIGRPFLDSPARITAASGVGINVLVFPCFWLLHRRCARRGPSC